MVTTGNIQQTPAIQQSALPFFLTVKCCILISFFRFPVWFPLQIFGICLAQNLVSDVKAVKANWWQVRWEGASPFSQAQPGQHSTLTVPSSWGRRAENIQLCPLCHWAKQHIHTLTSVYVQTQQVYFPVYQRHLKGEKIIPHEPNTLFTTQLGFEPKYTEDSPAYFRARYFFFSSVSSDFVFWTCVFVGHSCIRTPLSCDIASHGWKRQLKQTMEKGQEVSFFRSSITLSQSLFPPGEALNISSYKQPVFNVLIPTSRRRGSWVAGRPAGQQTHRFPLRVIFLHRDLFMTTEKTLRTLAGQVCNFKSFQEILFVTQNVKSAINFPWYFCLLPVRYMEFLHPAPIPQGLAENTCFLPTV